MAAAPSLSRRLLLGLSLLLALGGLALAVWVTHLRSVQQDYFLERGGALATVERQAAPAARAGEINESLLLRAEDGLSVRLRVRRPAAAAERCRVLLVLGGHRTGKDAVDLARPAGSVAYVAIDYPYYGPEKLGGIVATLRAMPAIQRAFLDTPPALSLVVDWLLAQDWVDATAIELVGVSLGTPFAATAAALDERIARLWLIHGAGDNRAWLNHNLRAQFPSDWQRRVATEIFYTLIYGESFRTDRWVAATVPRPVVVVAAHGDERLPDGALQPLLDAAARHSQVELIWTDGLHVQPNRPDVVQQLLQTVLDRGAPAR